MRQRVNTRFMQGVKTQEVFEILTSIFGMAEVCRHSADFEEAIYSAGFMRAIDNERMPSSLELIPSYRPKRDGEYHHVIVDGECYVMYF